MEKFAVLFFKDFNEIKLKYEFEEENIHNNSVELFGEIFVNNNEENCFIIINEKLLNLNRYIFLPDIFDDSDENINFPIKLDVKLIERKNKIMNDL